MKKVIHCILLGTATAAFAACSPDMPVTYEGTDGIYFNAASDSIAYTFAKYPSRTVDTLKIPVTVLGSPAAVDREIAIESLTGPDVTAKEGLHYKLLRPYKMPANSISTWLPVVVYRTVDLDSIKSVFQLALRENGSFVSGITSKKSIKIKTGFLQKPATWGEFTGIQWAGFSSNYGSWTKAKYKLILEALYDPVSDTTVTEFPYTRFSAPAAYLQYLQLTKNYIRTKYPGNYSTPRGIGATLRDPDNYDSVIQVQPANY